MSPDHHPRTLLIAAKTSSGVWSTVKVSVRFCETASAAAASIVLVMVSLLCIGLGLRYCLRRSYAEFRLPPLPACLGHPAHTIVHRGPALVHPRLVLVGDEAQRRVLEHNQ